MPIWLQILLICLACMVFALALLSLLIGAAINSLAFGSRQDKLEGIKYFTPEDYSLNVESFPVYLRKAELCGNLYSIKPVEECERLVVFQHGYGAGTASYMTEIAHLARQGFAVLAVDAYACNNSPGKGIRGFYAGAEVVIAACLKARSDERLKDKKIVLVGHSWGAYSVMCASAKVKVDGVVALSGFDSPLAMITDSLKEISPLGKFYAPIVTPALALINACRFGSSGNAKASKSVEKSGVPALIIHGAKDTTVALSRSAAARAKGENVKVVIEEDKKHNPYNTVAAEEKLAELFTITDDNALAEFDWHAVTEEDANVMSQIDQFILSV